MGESKEKAKPSFTPIITPPAEILLQTQASRPIQGQQIFATVVCELDIKLSQFMSQVFLISSLNILQQLYRRLV